MRLAEIIINHIGKRVQNNELNNNDMIEIIDTIGSDFLGLKTISDKSKEMGVDYNIVKKSKIEKRVLFGVKFVIDNA